MATLQNGDPGTFLRWLATFPTKLIIPPCCVSLPYQWKRTNVSLLRLGESNFKNFPEERASGPL